MRLLVNTIRAIGRRQPDDVEEPEEPIGQDWDQWCEPPAAGTTADDGDTTVVRLRRTNAPKHRLDDVPLRPVTPDVRATG